ncbi:MAG: serine hydrolase domain-containing protein, partial [Thermomicrobiales bacterium]
DMVGAAVAVVDAKGIVHSTTLGVRDMASGTPVTLDTHFLVASTTKSMTSLLVATFVDDGSLAWDQPVHEIWPDFRAPTEELTKTLRIRDLLGMTSGIGEPAAVSSFHQGDPTAAELLSSIAILPIIDPSQTRFFYNNSVYATGGYLPALVQGTAPNDLETAYARLMEERVYRPAGMKTARIADNPQPFVADYATGYASDLLQGTAVEPWGPVGSFAPVGGTLASLSDMANYVAMQLNQGVSTAGTRVVSAANLAECWQPHIDIPISPTLDPDLRKAGYGMGWMSQTYRDGRSLVWHNGGIDGFTTYLGFLPEDDLGLVVLTNLEPSSRSLSFYQYVLNLLLGGRFGYNKGINDVIVSQYKDATKQLTDLAAQTGPVDPAAIAPYLGFYQRGYSLAFDERGALRVRQSARSIRLLALPDGGYVMASGIAIGVIVNFSQDRGGMRWMEITDIETVHWFSEPA